MSHNRRRACKSQLRAIKDVTADVVAMETVDPFDYWPKLSRINDAKGKLHRIHLCQEKTNLLARLHELEKVFEFRSRYELLVEEKRFEVAGYQALEDNINEHIFGNQGHTNRRFEALKNNLEISIMEAKSWQLKELDRSIPTMGFKTIFVTVVCSLLLWYVSLPAQMTAPTRTCEYGPNWTSSKNKTAIKGPNFESSGDHLMREGMLGILFGSSNLIWVGLGLAITVTTILLICYAKSVYCRKK